MPQEPNVSMDILNKPGTEKAHLDESIYAAQKSMPMTPQEPKESWEEEFDKSLEIGPIFVLENGVRKSASFGCEEVKAFIRKAVSTAERSGWEKGAKEARAHYYERVATEAVAQREKELRDELALKVSEIPVDLCQNSQEFKHEVISLINNK